MIPNGSWACFTDGDAMFTVNDFGHQLQEIIENTDCSLLTAMTNRVGTSYQCVDNCWDADGMRFHRGIGNAIRSNEVVDITNEAPISGVLMLVNKDAWFTSARFKENGLLGVDNSIHYAIRSQGGKVGLMKGVYMMHWYRGGIRENKHHLM
jgi:hypothetical protein